MGDAAHRFHQRWWLPLTEQEIAKLLPGSGKGATGIEGIEAFGLVDRAAWKQIMSADNKAGNKSAGAYRSIITCYNGQTVNTTSGGEDGAVNEIEPIVSGGNDTQPLGRVAYRPIITPIHDGTALQVTPVVNTSGKFVMLDVHSASLFASRSPPAGASPRATTNRDRPQS